MYILVNMGGIVMVKWEEELIREVINIKCWEVCLEFSVQRFNEGIPFWPIKLKGKVISYFMELILLVSHCHVIMQDPPPNLNFDHHFLYLYLPYLIYTLINLINTLLKKNKFFNFL